MHMSIQRGARVAAAAATVAALALTGCSGQAADDGPVTLRMVWWGDEVRGAATQAVIDAFEAENPDIRIAPEPLPFDGYFDRLSTQIAANDAPDIIQLTVENMPDYGEGGALLDLDAVDLSDLDVATTEAANVDDEQWGVASGLATRIVVANPALFEQAGVEMPDDTTWTWDDYIDIAAQISAASPEGIFGAQPLGTDGESFLTYLRQQGVAGYDEDGQIAFEADDVVDYLELTEALRESGGAAGPEVAAEQTSLPLEQTGTATSTTAMGIWASGQFTALADNSGQDLVPLRLPALEAGDAELAIGVAQYWSVSSRTEHPEQAQLFLDYLVNSEEAGLELGLVRGTPPNTVVAEAVAGTLDGPSAAVTELVTEIGEDAVSVPLPPAGFGSFQDVFRRYVAEFQFGRLSAEEAGQGLVDETAALVS